MHPIIENMMDR